MAVRTRQSSRPEVSVHLFGWPLIRVDPLKRLFAQARKFPGQLSILSNELSAVPSGQFGSRADDKACDWIDIVGDRLSTQAHRFKRNCSPTRGGIKYGEAIDISTKLPRGIVRMKLECTSISVRIRAKVLFCFFRYFNLHLSLGRFSMNPKSVLERSGISVLRQQ